ncbi:MAG: phytochelatin synthase family protein [Nostocaceae cyanobacterium]|nr:phytochelatin synthase family protein [Nostocaceae cyanobacterium]
MQNIKLSPLKTLTKSVFWSLLLTSSNAFAQTVTISPSLIPFNSDPGEKLLVESKSREDFFPLTMHFVTQDNLAYCGVATMVMVLNALKIPAPETPKYRQYRIFTQDNLFNNQATQKVLRPEVVSRRGMTLEQLGALFASYDVDTKVYHAENTSLKEFRKLAASNLKQPGNFVVVNYLRKEIGQNRGGHISPLAAYNEKTDRFLILDVSRYKYPPVWVKAADLWKAMNTIDSDSRKTRGFVFVSRK